MAGEKETEASLRSGKVTERQVEDLVTDGLECGADAYCAANFGLPPGVCSGLVSFVAGPLVAAAFAAIKEVGTFVGFGRQAAADRDYDLMVETGRIKAASLAQLRDIEQLAAGSLAVVATKLSQAGGVTTGAIAGRLAELGVSTGYNGITTAFERVYAEAADKSCAIPALPPLPGSPPGTGFVARCSDLRVDWKKREGYIQAGAIAGATAATDYYADWALRLQAATVQIAGELAAEKARAEATRLMTEKKFEAARGRYAIALERNVAAERANDRKNAAVAVLGIGALAAVLLL
jgi:hypothetical protein